MSQNSLVKGLHRLAMLLLLVGSMVHAQEDPGAQAVALVQSLYDTHSSLRSNELPGITQTPGLAREFFDPDIISDLVAVAQTFDPVFAGADAINTAQVSLDPALGVLRGTAFVVVELDTVDGPRSLNYLVRRHPAVDALRILEIEGADWTLSDLLAGTIPTPDTAPPGDDIAVTADNDTGTMAERDEPSQEPSAVADDNAPPGADRVFPYQENFSSELAPVWQILNPDLNAYLPEDSGLFVLTSGGEDHPAGNPEPTNLFTLPTALPEEDFDLSLDFSLDARSGFDRVLLGLRNDQTDFLLASVYVFTKGCGPALYLRVWNRRPLVNSEEPLNTRFTRNLFDGPLADDICTGGRAYGNAVLTALASEGGTLSLSRRGRRYSAAFEMTLPPWEDQPAEQRRVETFAVSRTQASGTPFFMLGQSTQANNREGSAVFRTFAFQPVGEE